MRIQPVSSLNQTFYNVGTMSATFAQSPANSDGARQQTGLAEGSPQTPEDLKTAKAGTEQELTDAEKRVVEQLKKRDAEVKAHERAHLAAGGPYVSGGATFEYQRGPDGKNYAVGGEVSIDVSSESTPEATIRKMQVVRRAALAPADPSSQDRSVAAKATQLEARARSEKLNQDDEENPVAGIEKNEEKNETAADIAEDQDKPETIANISETYNTLPSAEQSSRGENINLMV